MRKAIEPGAMQIGEIATRTGLSLRTIRYYEEIGLVVPTVRTSGGFRIYTEGDFERLLLVKAVKPLGLGLDETRAMLEARDRLHSQPRPAIPDDEARLMIEYLSSAQERLRRLRANLKDAEEAVRLLGRDVDALRR
ncbi:MAG: MerR family transcriptional regulator [Actinomycetota bacterium]